LYRYTIVKHAEYFVVTPEFILYLRPNIFTTAKDFLGDIVV